MHDKPNLFNHRLLLPLAIFLIAFGFRLYYQNAGLYHTDSVFMAQAVEQTVSTLKLHYMHDPGYPGQVVLASVIYFFHKTLTGAQSAEWAVNFTSVLFGSLSVLGMYLLVKELFGRKTLAAYASLILSFLPVFLSISTYAKSHAAEMFFIITCAYLALYSGKTKKNKHKLLAALALGYACAIRVTSFLFWPTLILLYYSRNPPARLKSSGESQTLMLKKKPEKILQELSILTLPALAAFLLLYSPQIMQRGFESFTTISSYAGFQPSLQLTLTSLSWVGTSVTPLGWLILIAGLLTFPLLFILTKTNYADKLPRLDDTPLDLSKYMLIYLSLFLWMILFFGYTANILITTPRYPLPAYIPAIIFMVVGLETLEQTAKKIGRNPQGYLALAVTVILIAWMFGSIQPILDYRKDYCGPKEFSLAIGENTAANSRVIGMDESKHYEYYADRHPIPRPSGGDLFNQQKMQKHFENIDRLHENNTKVYITWPQGLSYDIPAALGYNPTERILYDVRTQKIFEYISLDMRMGHFYDKETKTTLPALGRPPGSQVDVLGYYTLSLFNRYRVIKVLGKENEDFHRNVVASGRYTSKLYELTPRNQ